MAYTARNLITDALKACGAIGAIETPSAEESAHGLNELNRIIEGWMLDGIQIGTTDLSGVATDATLTIGAAGDIVATIPTEVYSVRISTGTDFEAIERISVSDFHNLPTSSGEPSRWAFEPRGAVAMIWLWPTPSTSYNVRVGVDSTVGELTLNSDMAQFPAGSVPALEYELADILSIHYGKENPRLGMVAAERKARMLRLRYVNQMSNSGLPSRANSVGNIYTRS